MAGGEKRTLASASRRPGSAGSMRAECAACGTRSDLARTPCASSAATAACTLARGPLMTKCSGPLSAAMVSAGSPLAASWAAKWPAARTPQPCRRQPGSACVSARARPRRAGNPQRRGASHAGRRVLAQAAATGLGLDAPGRQARQQFRWRGERLGVDHVVDGHRVKRLPQRQQPRSMCGRSAASQASMAARNGLLFVQRAPCPRAGRPAP